ncbi:remorin 4.1-like [Phoenix dactylifera]|uniref:Remorin 4.1-like n=1 Tax=Phoenix dactylifera TaxID=42345 RepID=A0A8B8ZHS9_PHODC|nr:remorin 4.1-like [Phoenix dactylifera]
MDYERIEKPSPPGGGFSPGKLRAILLGVEKKKKEDEMESKFSLKSAGTGAELDDTCGRVSDEFKDVDMVSSLPEFSTSLDTMGGHGYTDQSLSSSRIRSQEEDSFDLETVSSTFEFHKAERALHRSSLVPPFSKPAPSKWDDAQKWIASPNLNRPHKASGVQPKKMEKFGYGSRQSSMKVVLEITEDVDTKRIDPSQEKREFGRQKAANWVSDPYPVVDPCIKPAIAVENTVADPAISLSRHDSSTLPQNATTFITPPSTVRSVSMRDMGTEMTPIASQEPSRTETPVKASTPTRSPTSSRSTTPQRDAPNSNIVANIIGSSDSHGDNNKELSEKELQMKTRREIMILGTQLGKTNIAAWASKEEVKDRSMSLKPVPVDQSKIVAEMRATAWEEAEKAKYQARFKQEEIKIQAWENHQKAKTEAEIRKIEVEVERMRARAHDKLMNKLAAAKHKAEEKRAAAEATRGQQATRTSQQAEYIRRTGHIPSSFSCWNWCS